MTFNPANSIAPFLQTSIYFPDDFDEFRVTFLQQFRNLADITNVRQIGIFDLEEFLTGEQWFSPTTTQQKRQTFRKVFSFGAIAAGVTLSFAHNITGITSTTDYRANVVTVVPDFRIVPYTSATLVTDQIQMTVTSTNIVIINGATAPNITSGIAILEYLKN